MPKLKKGPAASRANGQLSVPAGPTKRKSVRFAAGSAQVQKKTIARVKKVPKVPFLFLADWDKDHGRPEWYVVKVSWEKPLGRVECDEDEVEVFLQAFLSSPKAHAIVPFGTEREDFTESQAKAWMPFVAQSKVKARATAVNMAAKSLEAKVKAVENIVRGSQVDFLFPHRDDPLGLHLLSYF